MSKHNSLKKERFILNQKYTYITMDAIRDDFEDVLRGLRQLKIDGVEIKKKKIKTLTKLPVIKNMEIERAAQTCVIVWIMSGETSKGIFSKWEPVNRHIHEIKTDKAKMRMAEKIVIKGEIGYRDKPYYLEIGLIILEKTIKCIKEELINRYIEISKEYLRIEMPLIKGLCREEDLDTQRQITEYKIESLRINEVEEEKKETYQHEVGKMGGNGSISGTTKKKDLISLKTPASTVSSSEDGINELYKKEMFNVLARDVGLPEDEVFMYSTFY